ncbi:Predicted P-loop ATPase/GTPase [Halorientalis persicus]|jgi:predicted P-loop ATPase/GTPase|uniref:Predicted P-loop ATPase/GTPase n=1 Tax=Halorientalis persicus TaxID=1367881 RepID=A0A1H8UFA6_9EURY|nr:ATPase [Halorientalis persicus]SEP01308.1 Predicted P-loop ATPase/GTPase [Halorientalis persicus]
MKLLVAGADRVDAGKTTFTVGLLDHLDAVGFKPRAGNDHWFHHDDYRHAVEQGRLFGKDAKRLAAASPGDLDPEDINPIHRLWRPSPGEGAGMLGQTDREFVVDRVAENYVVNDTVEIPAEVRKCLPLEEAVHVSSLPELNEIMGNLHLVALDGIARRIEERERAVVESYGDVARPLREFEPDAVAVVEPARVRIYEGQRYRKACSITSGGPEEGQLEERVPGVVDLIDPVGSAPLPALSSDEREDPSAVASAYERGYEELLATAE